MPSGPPGSVRYGSTPSPATVPYTVPLLAATPSGLPVQPYGAATVPCAPLDPAPAALANIRSSISLPCERRRGTWQIRPVGGWAFTSGSDAGESDLYAGVDIGYTFSGCFGLDLYYRYSAQTFDIDVPGGVLEDSGGFHHLGLKATYQGAFSRSSRFTWWTGLGLGWYEATDYSTSDSDFEGYLEAGIGYLLTSRMRLRIGANMHALETRVGRKSAGSSGSSRLLWVIAPTIALEIDL
jgi:hypothetical protein